MLGGVKRVAAKAGRMAALLLALVTLIQAGSIQAGAQTPHRGGTLNVSIFAALPTLDCHALGSSSLTAGITPGYSGLLRYDPDNFPKVVGDLADSWTLSPDRKAYTFKLRQGVKFHDGTPLAAEDVKVSYDRLRNPPPGVVSVRQTTVASIDSIEAPDPATVVVHLKKDDPALLLAFANPLNCIYSAKDLAKDPNFPATHMNGTGPFKLVDQVPGTSVTYVRNDAFYVPNQPYLDGVKVVVTSGPGFINALAGGQVDATFTQMTFSGRDIIKAQRGDKMTFPETPLNLTNMVDVNTTKAPLNDVRVRRALNLALDRRLGDAMMQKSTMSKGFGALFTDGAPLGLTAEEIATLPGFGPDVAANRAEAKKLLAEAGQSNLKLTLLSRNAGEPYTTLGVFVVDQLRQIGVTVEQRVVETGAYYAGLTGLNFDIAIDANATVSSDPSEVLIKSLPGSSSNYTGAKDDELQALFDKQAVETDPAKRKALVAQFERRMVDQAYILPMFRSINLAAVASKVHGWKILPAAVLNVDLRQIWMDP